MQLKLQGKGVKKRKKEKESKKERKKYEEEPIDISESNQRNMLKIVTGGVCHLACIFNSV